MKRPANDDGDHSEDGPGGSAKRILPEDQVRPPLNRGDSLPTVPFPPGTSFSMFCFFSFLLSIYTYNQCTRKLFRLRTVSEYEYDETNCIFSTLSPHFLSLQHKTSKTSIQFEHHPSIQLHLRLEVSVFCTNYSLFVAFFTSPCFSLFLNVFDYFPLNSFVSYIFLVKRTIYNVDFVFLPLSVMNASKIYKIKANCLFRGP